MSLLNRIRGRIQRTLSNRCARRPATLSIPQPIVSFTFDDFPRSALFEAGSLLRECGWMGTYYASFGLMGRTTATGPIFTADDLPEFVRQGHELACHTFDHCHSWNTEPTEFDASLMRNQHAVAEFLPGTVLRTLSYPISNPRPQTKRCVSRHYVCARAGGQTFNVGKVDLNLLNAFFIEQSRDHVDAIKRIIDDTVGAQGWLILATHDVAATPTRYGCTPNLFKDLVKYISRSGASVLPVWDALQLGTTGASPVSAGALAR